MKFADNTTKAITKLVEETMPKEKKGEQQAKAKKTAARPATGKAAHAPAKRVPPRKKAAAPDHAVKPRVSDTKQGWDRAAYNKYQAKLMRERRAKAKRARKKK